MCVLDGVHTSSPSTRLCTHRSLVEQIMILFWCIWVFLAYMLYTSVSQIDCTHLHASSVPALWHIGLVWYIDVGHLWYCGLLSTDIVFNEHLKWGTRISFLFWCMCSIMCASDPRMHAFTRIIFSCALAYRSRLVY